MNYYHRLSLLINKYNSCSLINLTIFVASYATLLLNHRLYSILNHHYHGSSAHSAYFFSMAIFTVLLLQISLMSCCFWGNNKITKILIILLLILTAIADYYMQHYGIYFDRQMLKNIIQTNYTEARELFHFDLIWYVSKYITLPVLFIAKIKIRPISFLAACRGRFILLIITTSSLLLITFSQYKNFASLLRNNSIIRYSILPMSYMVSGVQLLTQQFKNFHTIAVKLDPQASLQTKVNHIPKLVVLLIGEAVRAQNWGLSGYQRSTTPALQQLAVVNFPYANSCGTNTNVSLPCMFSVFGRRNYDKTRISNTESVLELLQQLGVSISWVENQSGCQEVCKKLPTYYGYEFDHKQQLCLADHSCFDEVLLIALQHLTKVTVKNQLLILHQIGNHGPAYYLRYPAQFERFVPSCHSNKLTDCSRTAIINAYDNAILYTDYLIAKIIKYLQTVPQREIFFIYLADHGESLGENQLYLHSLPYYIAPAYQKRVPMLFWHSKNFPVNKNCLQQKAKQPADHDHLYSTLLGLFKVRSKTYERNYDLLADCYV